MAFDPAILTPAHAWIFSVSFALAGGGLWVAIRRGRKYGGWIFLLTTVALSFFLLPTLLGLGLALAGVVVAGLGALDERRPLTAWQQWLGQWLVAGILIVFGWTIPYVTNPWGPGVIMLGGWGALLALAWLVGLINAVNWLDGIDGLASGVGFIAFVVLGAISLLPATQDVQTLTLALIGAGASLAFLLSNWPPARVFLGTTGAWWLGLLIGLTAMIGGGKIATATLVLALPILDVGLVIIQRLRWGQRPWQGDRSAHLHYRLRAAGWSARGVTAAGMIVTLGLGMAAVWLPTGQKVWALLVFGGMLGLLVFIGLRSYAQKPFAS